VDGVVGMPGYANRIDESVLSRNPGLKILLIVGEKDYSWKSRSVEASRTLRDMGANVSLKIIPDEGHILKGVAGSPFFELLNQKLLGH
jgi:predicted esterase